MDKTQAFISFDPDHDRELFDVMVAQSQSTSSGFEIVGSSDGATGQSPCSERTTRRIRDADQLIVICGEFTEASASMGEELRIAQEQDKPYILLWGRREIMCTKPAGAKSSDGMYSWTLPILRDQMDFTTRSSRWKTPTDAFGPTARQKRAATDTSSG